MAHFSSANAARNRASSKLGHHTSFTPDPHLDLEESKRQDKQDRDLVRMESELMIEDTTLTKDVDERSLLPGTPEQEDKNAGLDGPKSPNRSSKKWVSSPVGRVNRVKANFRAENESGGSNMKSSLQANRFMQQMRTLNQKFGLDDLPKQVRELSDSMVTAVDVAFVAGALGFALVGYGNEIVYVHRKELWAGDKGDWIMWPDLLKIICCGLSVVVYLALLQFHLVKAEVHIIKHPSMQGVSRTVMLFSNAGLRNGLFLDLLFALPQPIPYFYYQWTWQCGLQGQTCTYEIDVLIILTMAMCRLVLLWRFIFAHSRFWEKQGMFQENFSILDIGPSLFQRYYHQAKPLHLHAASFCIYLFVWSFIHCMFERAAEDFTDVSTMAKLDTHPIVWRNLVWMHIVTATSVGYGEYVTHTYPGRGFLVVTICAGAYFIGLIVSAIGYSMELNNEEYDLLRKVQEKELRALLELRAAEALQQCWRAKKLADMKAMTGFMRAQFMEESYTKAIEHFKSVRKMWLNHCTKDLEVEPMVERLVMVGAQTSQWETGLTRTVKGMARRQKLIEKRQARVEKELFNVNKSADSLLRVLEKLSGRPIQQQVTTTRDPEPPGPQL